MDQRGRGRSTGSELAGALASARRAFVGLALVSGVINLLYLTGSFYMLEVYDRVIPGRSVPTLVALTILAFSLFAVQGLLDAIRSRIFVRIGNSLDENLSARVYDTVVRLPLKARGAGDGLQPMRDLDTIRGFLSGSGPTAFFDLPWMPFYLAICFLFHPWIGLAALAGAIVLTILTLATEFALRGPARASVALGQTRTALADASRRNAEAVVAMGMAGRLGAAWSTANARFIASQARTSDVAGGLGAISKVVRLALQSGVLGLGAFLVLRGEVTAGIIIASSILTARALAPVELAIANWRGFVGARQSWARLRGLLSAMPPHPERTNLPKPEKSFTAEALAVAPPGSSRLAVTDVSFRLAAGQGLGIVGPSASGKSSLARLLTGVWTPARGKIRLDGAALDQWHPEALGRHLGYLPQDVELFAGTVAQNIARFDPDADGAAIIAAARAAGVHDLVLHLPEGYETEIGEGGAHLSAGQRQRVALARALCGDPFLVVLDEPNSHLDSEGERALTAAIAGVRKRGGIVVVIAHRPSALAAVDLLLLLGEGRSHDFGPKDEVLGRLARSHSAAAGAAGAGPVAPLRVVKEGGT